MTSVSNVRVPAMPMPGSQPGKTAPVDPEVLKKLKKLLSNPGTGGTGKTTPANAPSNKQGSQQPADVVDLYPRYGSFTLKDVDGKNKTVVWTQAPGLEPHPAQPPGAQRVVFKVGLDDDPLSYGWIDANGVLHYHFGRNGKIISGTTPIKLTPAGAAASKLGDFLRGEDAVLRSPGGKDALKSAVRNTLGKILTTGGALLLASLINKAGVDNVVNRTTALGRKLNDVIRAQDNRSPIAPYIEDALKEHGLKWAPGPNGMQVTYVDAEYAKQYLNRLRVADGAPVPSWVKNLTNTVSKGGFQNDASFGEYVKAGVKLRAEADKAGASLDYSRQLAAYFSKQSVLFAKPLSADGEKKLASILRRMMNDVIASRSGKISQAEFDRRFEASLKQFERLGPSAYMDELRKLLSMIPGFEVTSAKRAETVALAVGRMKRLHDVGAALEEFSKDGFPKEVPGLIVDLAGWQVGPLRVRN